MLLQRLFLGFAISATVATVAVVLEILNGQSAQHGESNTRRSRGDGGRCGGDGSDTHTAADGCKYCEEHRRERCSGCNVNHSVHNSRVRQARRDRDGPYLPAPETAHPTAPDDPLKASHASSAQPPSASAAKAPAFERRSCVVCIDAEPSTAYIPCGHLCACAACAAATMDAWRGSRRCPVCNTRAAGVQQIFF
ncbi:hypothetical protein JKP88DRAFT_243076 [Tribonema minus]|uniref:RING-type domain-containing protein n=1 Tax=Tribonema minus TaxID=303371 RepID=A0A835ZJX5_9STRA|nr:hypothetical protein JKP88DRAFT_243076 [Tribonema minus]